MFRMPTPVWLLLAAVPAAAQDTCPLNEEQVLALACDRNSTEQRKIAEVSRRRVDFRTGLDFAKKLNASCGRQDSLLAAIDNAYIEGRRCGPPPRIAEFEVAPPRAPHGSTVRVRWRTIDAAHTALDGQGVSNQGAVDVPNITARRTFVLRASDAHGRFAEERRSVEVEAAPPPPPPPPEPVGEPLTVSEFVLMTEAGVPHETVMKLIRSRRVSFRHSSVAAAKLEVPAEIRGAIVQSFAGNEVRETARPPLTLRHVELIRGLGASVPAIAALAKARTCAISEPDLARLNSPGDAALVGELAGICSQPVAPPPKPAQPASAVNPLDELTYVQIPKGTFIMGCSENDTDCGGDEKPPRQRTIPADFWLSQTEVTGAAYRRFAGATRQLAPAESLSLKRPIVNVTWQSATDYCAWAGGRLPTEAEWEYAARAGDTGVRPKDIDAHAWHLGNSGRQLPDAGTSKPNAFGLYDMLGSVMEWTSDSYNAAEKVNRGGAFDKPVRFLRYSARDKNAPRKEYSNLGFRCVWNRTQ